MRLVKKFLLSDFAGDLAAAGVLLVGLLFAALVVIGLLIVTLLIHQVLYWVTLVALWLLLTLYVRKMRLNETS